MEGEAVCGQTPASPYLYTFRAPQRLVQLCRTAIDIEAERTRRISQDRGLHRMGSLAQADQSV